MDLFSSLLLLIFWQIRFTVYYTVFPNFNVNYIGLTHFSTVGAGQDARLQLAALGPITLSFRNGRASNRR